MGYVSKKVDQIGGAVKSAVHSVGNALDHTASTLTGGAVGGKQGLTWTGVRDALETGAVLAGNYFLPGSSILTSKIASKGSQAQLNTTDGMLANLAAGGAGALNGNMSNYGKIGTKLGVGGSPAPGSPADLAAIDAADPVLNAPTMLDNAKYYANAGLDSVNGTLGTNITGTDLLKTGSKYLLSGALGDNGQGDAQDSAANAAHTAEQIASEQWNSYKENFLPVEKKMSAMAMNAGSDANIAQEGDIAGANAENQISLANAAKTRGLQRMGVNPNSGNALALANENANNEALTRTTAINGARRNTMNDAFTKVQSTVNAGKGTPATSMNGLSNAVNNYGKVAQTAGNNNALTDKLVSKGVDWALSKL